MGTSNPVSTPRLFEFRWPVLGDESMEQMEQHKAQAVELAKMISSLKSRYASASKRVGGDSSMEFERHKRC